MRPIDKAAKLASRQHGTITRRQALRLHVTKGEIRQLLRAGRWRVFEPGTYLTADAPRSWRQVVRAATLAVGERAAGSHGTAAFLLGFTDRRPSTVDVTAPHGSHDGRSRGYRVHRARTLSRADVVMVDGIPVTCPARTIVDVAGVVSRRALEAILDSALLSGRISIAALRRYIRKNRLSHLRRVGVLVALLDDRELGVPESELEREFLRVVRRYRLPVPVRQHRELRYRVDFAYVDARLMVEVDGRASHATARAFAEDRRRQNRLVLEGWTVLRFTWTDVKHQPEEVAGVVRAALCRAGSVS